MHHCVQVINVLKHSSGSNPINIHDLFLITKMGALTLPHPLTCLAFHAIIIIIINNNPYNKTLAGVTGP